MKKNIILSFVFVMAFAFVTIGQDMDLSGESLPTATPQDMSPDNYFLQRSIFSIDYNFAFPLGDLNDFMPSPSFVGFDAELKGMVAHGLFVGGMIGYQSYYKKYPRDTYYFENGALTSTIFKYYYTVPIRVVADYFLAPNGFVQPFVGLSTGVNYNERRLEVGFYSFEDKSWNYVVAPEVGVIIPFGRFSDWGFSLRARYNYQVYSRDNFSGLQYIDVNFGFSYSY